ncbi:MAG: acyltransferase family protein [Hyphomicrobiales bacterium]
MMDEAPSLSPSRSGPIAARPGSGAAPAEKAKEAPHWPFLDLVRFGAALLVLFGHSRGLYFVGIAQAPDAGIATRLFYLVTGLQHEGVILFFVVSGFLVGGSVWRNIEAGRFEARLYLINRFSRIYLVLIPALVLVFILDRLGMSFLADTRFYAERPLFPSGVYAGWTWSQIPCHLASLQGAVCNAWGADPPLWSLGWEWVFYLLAPILFGICLLPLRPLARAAGLAVICASLFTLFGVGDWLLWLFTWLIGVAASLMATRREVPLGLGLGGLVLCAAALITSRAAILPVLVTDLGIGIGLTLAVACRAIANAPILEKLAARGAGFSYSLYLIHLPMGIFAGAVLERLGFPATLMLPGPSAYAAFALIAAAALGAAMLFASLTEKHTARFRRFLARSGVDSRE